jgi:hypothetical protein
MHTGFTGSRNGMTREQVNTLVNMMDQVVVTGFFSHGDCIGSDATAHSIAIGIGLKVILHPPLVSTRRAWCYGAFQVRPAKGYIERNHVIVNESDVLIATPDSIQENLRSGTWATVRYCRKQGKPVWLILPDGSLK